MDSCPFDVQQAFIQAGLRELDFEWITEDCEDLTGKNIALESQPRPFETGVEILAETPGHPPE